MSIGQGFLDGFSVVRLLGIRPGDTAYVQHSGATYTPQDDNGGGNVAIYEINNPTDEIEFTLPDEVVRQYDEVKLRFYTVFGPTDFTVYANDVELTSDLSGFDSENWTVGLNAPTQQIRVSDFDTDAGVDGTQAAWYPYVSVLEPTEY